MPWRLFGPAGVAPQVGIDRSLDDEGAVFLVERPDGIGQQVNGPVRDETVNVKAPGVGPFGPKEHERDPDHHCSRRAHAWYISV